MNFTTRNNKVIRISKYCPGDLDDLFHYLQHLGEATRKRFGPHPFDRSSLQDFHASPEHAGYIATENDAGRIIAYAIIKNGMLHHDIPRLQSYGLQPDASGDCTFAPSVADDWQSFGIGDGLFRFILSDVSEKKQKRIILWGGVQADNQKAVNYYLKNGFNMLGQFDYNGPNYDMILNLP
ncbi:GNAT family N-acetyltransferase [Flavihumibacter stibioxidans]|uniref:N-acetyltransferase domain-containing protein n=1 Tax=Flavihumibacter stibioxidans TaxID=1834163 RepID=A0ABR7MEQ2_9BACT|nr:GNAT family N-acetyltransferase [Flavihumibacter stibioxidans]MBC6492999.1 hypothetical protein [Flavihumibacter stibioxidans]